VPQQTGDELTAAEESFAVAVGVLRQSACAAVSIPRRQPEMLQAAVPCARPTAVLLIPFHQHHCNMAGADASARSLPSTPPRPPTVAASHPSPCDLRKGHGKMKLHRPVAAAKTGRKTMWRLIKALLFCNTRGPTPIAYAYAGSPFFPAILPHRKAHAP
jgi:hypothetical protein